MVSKVFAQKKGGKVMTATNMCSNFGGFRCSPPLVNRIFVRVSSCLFCCICIIVVGWLESVHFTPSTSGYTVLHMHIMKCQ